METKDIIRVYQDLLPAWRFTPSISWAENFAIKRFSKKMEVPDQTHAGQRRETCFASYVQRDEDLPPYPGLLPRKWYVARQTIHQMVRNFRLAPVSFTNGSEVVPTRGLNSLESKLSKSGWHCTFDCWELWALTAYETCAIKRATRKRFARVMEHDSAAIRRFHKESWKLYKGRRSAAFLCFRRMLARVTEKYSASRFTTVRKNNSEDRPIAVEGLANMLVQRRIGNGIRVLLKEEYGVDLDTLAGSHRQMIRNAAKATIDLSSASDSITCWLIDFLFPKWFLKLLYGARAPFLEGLDGHYYVLKKISSMGCGFTFELMSLVLFALGRAHDSEFSVFGDDIIVSNSAALEVISDLEAVGFVVNSEKSHINSKFRESCGANWHDDYGYIRSFDFWYPQSIHDCIVVYNKAALLGRSYPQFKTLADALARPIPPALQGPTESGSQEQLFGGARDRDEDVLLSTYFRTGRSRGGLKVDDRAFSGTLRDYQLEYNHKGRRLSRRYFYGFQWVPRCASRRKDTLKMKRDFGKYLMYLHGLRIVDDGITGRGTWQRITFVQVGGRALRVKPLVAIQRSAARSDDTRVE